MVLSLRVKLQSICMTCFKEHLSIHQPQALISPSIGHGLICKITSRLRGKKRQPPLWTSQNCTGPWRGGRAWLTSPWGQCTGETSHSSLPSSDHLTGHRCWRTYIIMWDADAPTRSTLTLQPRLPGKQQYALMGPPGELGWKAGREQRCDEDTAWTPPVIRQPSRMACS